MTRSILASLAEWAAALVVGALLVALVPLVFDDDLAGGAQPPDVAPTHNCPTLAFEWPRGTVWFAAGADGGRCEVALSVMCRRDRRDGSVRAWPVQRTEWLADGDVEAWRIRCGAPKRSDAVRFAAHGYPRRT